MHPTNAVSGGGSSPAALGPVTRANRPRAKPPQVRARDPGRAGERDLSSVGVDPADLGRRDKM